MDSQSTGGLPAADWYPDPSDRHELRYWDGAAWTDHVADGGQMSVDRVDGRPAQAVEGQPAQVVVSADAEKQGSRAQGREAPQHPTAQGPDDQRKGMDKRTRTIIILCAVVVLAGIIAAGVVLNQRHQRAEQVKRQAAALVAEAKVADHLGSEFGSDVTDYTDAVAAIEPALARNATAVKVWKKQRAKLQAVYRKSLAAYRAKVASVNAYNKSRWIPNQRTTYYEDSRPGYLLYLEPRIPSGNVWWSDGGRYASEINGVLTRRSHRPRGPRRKLPPHPKLKTPSKIKDPVGYRVNTLMGLTTRLDTLTAELGSAKLGPAFVPVADEIRSGIELLRKQVDLAIRACQKAVRRDRRIGYVAVHMTLEGVDVTVVSKAVQAVRSSLLNAAQTHGVDVSKLTWAPAQP
ncbi:MAG TPA: DUF2510 domain-containing protein [Candidatus Limnocylindrales bacterium]